MTATIYGRDSTGEPFSYSSTYLRDFLSNWSNIRKKNSNLPDAIDIMYCGDLAIIYPEYNSRKPSYKFYVKSDQFPYSIINDDYCVVLSKAAFTPTVQCKYGIYFKKGYDNGSEIVFSHLAAVDIFTNKGYTIAQIINALNKDDPYCSFHISPVSDSSFTYKFSTDAYIPFITTPFAKLTSVSNIFLPNYFINDISVYKDAFNKEYTQTIDFKVDHQGHVVFNSDSGDKIFNPVVPVDEEDQ